MDGIKRQIMEALVAIDKKGLDPVRGAMGLPQYHQYDMPNDGNVPVPTPRPSQSNPNKMGLNEIRRSGQAERAHKMWEPKHLMAVELMKQADAMRNAPQQAAQAPAAPPQQFAGVTSDMMAQALPQPQQGPPMPQEYQIRSGDTLTKIAQALGLSVDDLVRMNNIKDPNRIYAGQNLRVA